MKNVFLYVRGDDYSAMDFERKYNPQEFYEQMVKDDVKYEIVYDDFYAEVRILEFGEIDSKFIDFIYDNLVDYEHSKHSNLIKVNGVQTQ